MAAIDQAEIAAADGVAVPPHRPVAANAVRHGGDLLAHHFFHHRQPGDGGPVPERHRFGIAQDGEQRRRVALQPWARKISRLGRSESYGRQKPEKHEAAGCFQRRNRLTTAPFKTDP